MKLKIRYESEYQTIVLDEEDTRAMWVSLSLEGEGLSQEETESRIQEAFDEKYNKPEYNVWHRETRHIDPTPKRKRMDGRKGYICADEDDAAFDIMDYLNTYDPTEDYGNKFEYEERCKKIRAAVKPAQADMLIAIILDGMTVAEYAEFIGDTANNVSHRYRRAVNNLKKTL